MTWAVIALHTFLACLDLTNSDGNISRFLIRKYPAIVGRITTGWNFHNTCCKTKPFFSLWYFNLTPVDSDFLRRLLDVLQVFPSLWVLNSLSLLFPLCPNKISVFWVLPTVSLFLPFSIYHKRYLRLWKRIISKKFKYLHLEKKSLLPAIHK